jgi:outer membrane protein
VKEMIRAVTYVVFILGFLLQSNVAAQDTMRLTLDESIDIALRNSTTIQSAREGMNASELRRKEAFTRFLPKLSTSYNYSHYDPAPYINQPPPFPFSTITTGTQDNYTWSLDVKQPVFTGGRIKADYDISRIGADISKHEERLAVQDTVLEVKRAYFNILKAIRLVGVAKQSVEQFTAQRDLAKNFYEVGLSPRNDYLQAEVRLADSTQALVRAKNSLEVARARFNTILRLPIGMPVEVVDILNYKPYEKNYEECLRAAIDHRPEIQVLALGVKEAGEKIRVVESEFYPSVNVVGSYQRYGDSGALSGSPYRDPDNWLFMAVASWDLWEWGRSKYSRDASVSQEKQAQSALTKVKDQVALDVKSAWLAVKEAENLIAVTQTSIEQAEENYRINQDQYREQVSRITDVLDALTLLTFARASYSNALSDYQIALAALEKAMGIAYPRSP